MTPRALALAAACSLAACSPSLIPGTAVKDTKANREVYGVIRAYAEAMQKRDAAAVLALVAPDYFDAAGTPAPEDDLDRAGLERALEGDFAKVDSLKLEIGVKQIEVKEDRAMAHLFYDGYFRVLTPGGPVPKRNSDLHLLQLRKVGPDWKITAGL